MDIRTYFTPKPLTTDHPQSTMDSFAPSAMNSAYDDFKLTKKRDGIRSMRHCNPKLTNFTDEEIVALYECAVSSFQSKSGAFLEKYVERALESMRIPFRPQVHIDAHGMIVPSNGTTIIDIVFGTPEIGTHISDYIVLSLKTTSRERAKLDGWARTYPPKVFYYGTVESDYPQPETFVETASRKLVCVRTKQKDLREFKFNFQDMAREVQSLLPVEGCSVPASL